MRKLVCFIFHMFCSIYLSVRGLPVFALSIEFCSGEKSLTSTICEDLLCSETERLFNWSVNSLQEFESLTELIMFRSGTSISSSDEYESLKKCI